MKMERLSDFASGERVELTRDCQVLHMAETIKTGTTGTLKHIYRIQDGLEVWHMVLDRPGYAFIAVAHTHVKRLGSSSG